MRLSELDDDGIAQLDPLNAEFNESYLKDPHNSRWVAKPTVAYLWARTVSCKQCRATLPLLKTRWLCKEGQQARTPGYGTELRPDGRYLRGAARRPPARRQHGAAARARQAYRGRHHIPHRRHLPLLRRHYDHERHPLRGASGRLGAVMTAVVVDGVKGKEYRLPTDHEIEVAKVGDERLQVLYADIPFGLPEEPLPSKEALGFRVPLYGFDTWRKLFTNRQLLALGGFVQVLRQLPEELSNYPTEWREAVAAYIALANDRMADYSSAVCSWHNGREIIRDTFARFALPIVWDYAEVNPLSDTSGNFLGAVEWVSRFTGHALESAQSASTTSVLGESAARPLVSTMP